MQAHIYHPVFAPAYLTLLKNGMLAERASAAWGQMEDCDLCARYCHINRLQSRKGAACRTAEQALVHSFGPHHGEEDPLRGSRGTGSLFFSCCNAHCSFCQKRGISHKGTGRAG